MTLAEALDSTRLHRLASGTDDLTVSVSMRPYHARHFMISALGHIGGGQVPIAGEVSRAHHGILFLDEWPEFKQNTLEVLSQPLEESIL